MRSFWLITWVVIGACGGTKPNTNGDPKPPPRDAAPPPVSADASITKPTARTTPTDKECDAMVDHVLQIAVIAHNKKEDPKYRPTKAQIDGIRQRMLGQLKPVCLRMDRAQLRCIMKATDRAGYAACGSSRPKGGGKASP